MDFEKRITMPYLVAQICIAALLLLPSIAVLVLAHRYSYQDPIICLIKETDDCLT
jgi:hypothetical protein